MTICKLPPEENLAERITRDLEGGLRSLGEVTRLEPNHSGGMDHARVDVVINTKVTGDEIRGQIEHSLSETGLSLRPLGISADAGALSGGWLAEDTTNYATISVTYLDGHGLKVTVGKTHDPMKS